MNIADHSPTTAFGRKAQSYEAHALAQREGADWLAQWLPTAATDQRCLEFGCGTGLLTQHLAQTFGEVEASDIEPQMLDTCRRSLPNLRYQIRDAWAHQPDTHPYDCIASASLLQWAEDPIQVLQSWRPLLKPNGHLLLGYFASPSLPELTSILPDTGPIQWRTPDQWRTLFEQAGYTCERMESQTKRHHHADALAFWRGLHGTGAVVPQQTNPKKLLRMLRKYAATFTEKGQVYATWTFSRTQLTAL